MSDDIEQPRHIDCLICDFESGEGSIDLDPEFMAETGLFKADVLKDWIFLLNKEYEKSIGEMYADILRVRQANQQERRTLHGPLAPEGECAECDSYRRLNISFHPPHDASVNCRSGKRNHCTCDTCF